MESGELARQAVLSEFGPYELTAQLLARWSLDDPERLADLAVLAADRHHHLVAEGLVTHRDKLVPLFRAELARRPFRIWEDLIERDLLYNGPAMVAAGVIADRAIAGPNGLLEESIIRRANAAAALFVLGHPEDAWPLLVHSPDPSVRSHLIRRLAAVGADPTLLAARYRAERDLSAKRALLLALGDIPTEKLPAKFRDPLVRELLDEYADHPDPGLHSTIGWLLRQQWNEAEAIGRIDAKFWAEAERRAADARKRLEKSLPNGPARPAEPDGKKRGWFVNAEGQEFAVVKGPLTTAFGSPIGEAGRMEKREPARRRQIEHSFAIATRELTAAEFRRFRPDHPKNPFNDDPNCPAVMIPWPDAAAYCNYLSEREGIPRDQWCYELDGKGGVTIREDRLTRRGFRLPTELEWECAGRAGCVTPRYYGRPGCLLSRYAWVDQNAGRNSHRGGLLRPNDWGLFDTLGNVWEWCEDAAVLDEPGRVVDNYWDTGDRNQRRVYRGASFFDDTPSVRLANRNSYRPGDAYYSIGLRLVRSLP